MKPVSIIGMGMSVEDLTPTHRRLIREADVLVGGRRHLAAFEDLEAEKREIAGNLADLPPFLSSRMDTGSVVVLASGDPLFYGIGAYLSRKLPPGAVRIYPNVTAVAAGFALLGKPWQHACVVSGHGRDAEPELLDAVAEGRAVAVYTDPEHHPGWVAHCLLRNGCDGWRLCVAEQMGTEAEQVRWFDPAEALERAFAEPNLVILEPAAKPPQRPALSVGMPDEAFAHQRGLITKPEIRAVSLAKLRLFSECVLWDLGAGSGAVGIEAACWVRRGRIVSVERDPERLAMIRNNRDRFGVHRLEAVQADLPDGMAGLPDPDRVFVGGGGARLDVIVAEAASRLRPGGVIVVNTVLVASLHTVCETLAQNGLPSETVQVQVNRSRPMPRSQRFAAENPVWIVTGRKGEDPS